MVACSPLTAGHRAVPRLARAPSTKPSSDARRRSSVSPAGSSPLPGSTRSEPARRLAVARANIKRRLFVATVESVLLYGCETWTMTATMEGSMDVYYTRMLRMALNVNWKEHLTNSQLYRKMERASTKIKTRRLQMAGHCVRHPELAVNPLVLWEPTHGKAVRGRSKLTYTELLRGDTGCASTEELQSAMVNRDVWRGFIRGIRAADPASTR